MGLFKWANEKVKKLTFIDIKLLAIGSICIGIILVELIPDVLNISIWWLVGIAILCFLRVYYVILFKK